MLNIVFLAFPGSKYHAIPLPCTINFLLLVSRG